MIWENFLDFLNKVIVIIETYTFDTLIGKAVDKQILFQTAGSLNMEDLISLHHYVMFYIFIIFIFVFIMTYFSYSSFYISNKYKINYTEGNINNQFTLDNHNVLRGSSYDTVKLSHNSLLEFIWTILPSVILLLISVPSFLFLYSVEESINVTLVVKVIAHQWYWVYEGIKY